MRTIPHICPSYTAHFFPLSPPTQLPVHNRLNEVRYCTSFHCIAVCSGWGLWISKEQCLFWETAVILVCTFHQYKLETRVLWLSGVFVLGIKSGFSRRQSQAFLWITDCWHNELYSAILYVLTRYIKCKKRFFFPTIPPSISFRFSSLGSQGAWACSTYQRLEDFFILNLVAFFKINCFNGMQNGNVGNSCPSFIKNSKKWKL